SALVFPNKISTEHQSLMFVKRLLAVSVSCITYLRGIFPEHLCVKILKEDKNCPGSSQLVKWYTPIQKILGKNQNSKSSTTSADTKKASILLIRKIYVLMQNLGPLPNDVCLTMKLFYYDEVTPPDYQPPGFKDGDCEGVIFDGDPTYLNVGEVPTPFHTFRLKVTTEKERMENIDSTILAPKQSKIPFRKILMDKDDVEDDNYNNFDIKTKIDRQKENLGASEIKEPNLDGTEEEIMQFKKTRSPSVSHCQ
ncbi:hypothetical protein A6R68_18392, partial [Neotoma lepida]